MKASKISLIVLSIGITLIIIGIIDVTTAKKFAGSNLFRIASIISFDGGPVLIWRTNWVLIMGIISSVGSLTAYFLTKD